MALEAGAAVVDITPRSPCRLAGYAARDHEHEGVYDRLSLRALYVRGGSEDVLLVSADIIWFCSASIERVGPQLEAQLGLKRENVHFFGTHTHSAPIPDGDRANREWLNFLESPVVAAGAIAKSRLQRVVVKAARGASDIGVNRRELRPDGSITLGLNPDGPNDREVIALAFEGGNREVVARVGNFACHGTVMSQGNYEISGDWPGPAATLIEASSGGAFLFLNGGAGNICPRIDRQDSLESVDDLGEAFASHFEEICTSLEPIPDDDTVTAAEMDVFLPRKQRDVEEGRGKLRKVRITGVRVGALRIVGFPGEVFSQTSMAVKDASPESLTMVCSYASGCDAGYVPVSEAYDTGGYEVRVSPYSEDAEAILRAGFLNLLTKL
jgi:hypothetical protein